MKDIKEPTEGEEYVMDFLDEVGIKYEREKKIVGLKGDNRNYRIADFYLPQYDAYIEFFGLWSKNVKDDDYKAKRDLYRNNGIPCVFLYPENLGVIDFSLDKRLQKTLIENGKYKELQKYRRFKFFKARTNNIGLLVFGFILLFLTCRTGFKKSDDYVPLFIAIGIIIYQTYRIITAYNDIFVKNKFSLLNVMQD